METLHVFFYSSLARSALSFLVSAPVSRPLYNMSTKEYPLCYLLRRSYMQPAAVAHISNIIGICCT